MPPRKPAAKKNEAEKITPALADVVKDEGRKEKIPCRYCGKKCSKNNMSRHIRTQHLDEKNFSCEYCESCYTTKDNLIKHIQLHLSSKEADLNSAIDPAEAPKKSIVHSFSRSRSQSRRGSSGHRSRSRRHSGAGRHGSSRHHSRSRHGSNRRRYSRSRSRRGSSRHRSRSRRHGSSRHHSRSRRRHGSSRHSSHSRHGSNRRRYSRSRSRHGSTRNRSCSRSPRQHDRRCTRSLSRIPMPTEPVVVIKPFPVTSLMNKMRESVEIAKQCIETLRNFLKEIENLQLDNKPTV